MASIDRWVQSVALAAAVFSFSASCTSETQNKSDIKNGFLASDLRSDRYLINVMPGQEVHACGDHSDLARDAILRWGQAAGRPLNVEASCAPTKHEWKIYAADGEGADRAVAACQASGWTLAFARPSQREIYLCRAVNSVVLAKLMLHEFGHAFGLCDQVLNPADRDFGDCDDATAEAVIESSIMGPQNQVELTPDDVRGIRRLAQLEPAGWPSVPVETPNSPLPALDPTQSEGPYMLRANYGQQCLTAVDATDSAEGRLAQQPCGQLPGQQWDVGSSDGSPRWTIRLHGSGRCIAVSGPTKEAYAFGLPLSLVPCDEALETHWTVKQLEARKYQFVSTYSGNCLNVRDASLEAGAPLTQNRCHDRPNHGNQAWEFVKSGD